MGEGEQGGAGKWGERERGLHGGRGEQGRVGEEERRGGKEGERPRTDMWHGVWQDAKLAFQSMSNSVQVHANTSTHIHIYADTHKHTNILSLSLLHTLALSALDSHGLALRRSSNALPTSNMLSGSDTSLPSSGPQMLTAVRQQLTLFLSRASAQPAPAPTTLQPKAKSAKRCYGCASRFVTHGC